MRDLEELSGWRGSREELVNVLQTLEDANPKTFSLFSKTNGKRLPVRKTRVQRLIEMEVLLGPHDKTNPLRAQSTVTHTF